MYFPLILSVVLNSSVNNIDVQEVVKVELILADCCPLVSSKCSSSSSKS